MTTTIRKHVLLFLPRFIEPIRVRTKWQTIRRPRKREIRPGDLLDHRYWIGKPRRSQQDSIGSAMCNAISTVSWDFAQPYLGMTIDGRRLDREQDLIDFLRRDGFASRDDFVEFQRTLPWGSTHCEGRVLISWRNFQRKPEPFPIPTHPEFVEEYTMAGKDRES